VARILAKGCRVGRGMGEGEGDEGEGEKVAAAVRGGEWEDTA
jgi:hypothetical protein